MTKILELADKEFKVAIRIRLSVVKQKLSLQ